MPPLPPSPQPTLAHQVPAALAMPPPLGTTESFTDTDDDDNHCPACGEPILDLSDPWDDEVEPMDCIECLWNENTLPPITMGALRPYALHEAAGEGRYLWVKEIIATGANINEHNQYGETPLHCAIPGVGRNKIDLVKILIANGAKINASHYDECPLDKVQKNLASCQDVERQRDLRKLEAIILQAGGKNWRAPLWDTAGTVVLKVVGVILIILFIVGMAKLGSTNSKNIGDAIRRSNE